LVGAGGSHTGTAGSQNASGGRINDTPPVKTVGTCNKLGELNQWQDISPPGLTKDPPYTGAIVVFDDPSGSGTLYVTGAKSGIFKSIDCGSNWMKINTGRNGDKIDSGNVWSAALDPIEPSTMYAITGYGPEGVWKSTNSGADWDNVLPAGTGMPGFVGHISMDPTNHQHILLSFHNNCSGGHAPVCFGETNDGGVNWNVVDFPSSIKDGWGESAAIVAIDSTHWLYESWELYATPDAGKTWSQVGAGNAVVGDYVETPDGSLYIASARGIMRRGPKETEWPLLDGSGYGLQNMIGDGKRLYGLRGFQPPENSDFVWSASYDAPETWTLLDTPGLTPLPPVAGGTDLAVDLDHHLLYVAAQAAGLWRVRTE
jgi:photosystem II stability/assembly factor-like uncharacterized protein